MILKEVENMLKVHFRSDFRLENGWFVRDVPSPVQSGGTSSLVSSSPPSETEFELNLNHSESSENQSKSTKKVRVRPRQAFENRFFAFDLRFVSVFFSGDPETMKNSSKH